MSNIDINTQRRSRWYFGGLSSSIAVCVTHPLDMLKVFLQTQQQKQLSVGGMISKVYRTQGIRGFYNGMSASLTRQLTYTTARFGLYETGKPYINNDSFFSKIALAGTIGMIASFIGVPTDMVNVRMQNDMKLPPEERRNYKHVFDGLMRISREEGIKSLFTGSSFAIARGVVITIGQNAVYDQVKMTLTDVAHYKDGVPLHFTASLVSGIVTTTVAQPLDVLKTRLMNSPPGMFHNTWDVFKYTASMGPLGFFKGYVPAFLRLGPHTIILYLIMEQLRLHFGILPKQPTEAEKNRVVSEGGPVARR